MGRLGLGERRAWTAVAQTWSLAGTQKGATTRPKAGCLEVRRRIFLRLLGLNALARYSAGTFARLGFFRVIEAVSSAEALLLTSEASAISSAEEAAPFSDTALFLETTVSFRSEWSISIGIKTAARTAVIAVKRAIHRFILVFSYS
ncbi:MAG: hypothetical protein ACLSAP_12365 [Oscillospiraceae bacterium]